MRMRMRTSKGGGRPNKGHTNGGAVSHPPRVPSPTATQSNSCTRWTGQRLTQRRRSLDESERLTDAFAEELLSDGGDIGDDEALAQGVSPQGRGFEPHS